MEVAVKEERYEDAATIRDQINFLKKKMEADS
jgi:protein-arginine kinase activator protein McsA